MILKILSSILFYYIFRLWHVFGIWRPLFQKSVYTKGCNHISKLSTLFQHILFIKLPKEPKVQREVNSVENHTESRIFNEFFENNLWQWLAIESCSRGQIVIGNLLQLNCWKMLKREFQWYFHTVQSEYGQICVESFIVASNRTTDNQWNEI